MLLEFSKEARRGVPEALGFLAGVIRLHSPNPGHLAVPSLEAAHNLSSSLKYKTGWWRTSLLKSLKNTFIMEPSPEVSASILSASLHLIEKYTEALKGPFELSAETELPYEVSESLLSQSPPEAVPRGVAKEGCHHHSSCDRQSMSFFQ
jgi:hypothetical protein